MRSIFTCVFAAVFFSFSLQAGNNVLKNGGFECVDSAGRATDWDVAGKEYTPQDGKGAASRRAMVFQAAQPAGRGHPKQRLTLKPGSKYRVSARIRTTDLVSRGDGAGVCIEWYDKNWKWMGGVYTRGIKGTTVDWVQVQADREVPLDAVYCSASCYVRKGSTGEARFDEMSVVEIVPHPVEALASSAYRNQASEGRVTFSALLNLEAGQAKRCRGVFRVKGSDGRPRDFEPDRLSDTAASVTVDVAGLPPGKSDVSFTLTDDRGGLIGRTALAFTRQDPGWKKPRVWLDGHGRTYVDGKPYFPLGVYLGKIERKDIERISAGPFNCVMPYHRPTREQMDLCHRAGLKAFYSLKDIYVGKHWAPKELKTGGDETNFVKRCVREFADHPATLAWYINDESGSSWLPRLAARRRLLEELDPEHPTWSVFMYYTDARVHLETTDVFGTDPYPISRDSSNNTIGTASDYTRRPYRDLAGVKPFWQVVQAFDWGVASPARSARTRAPTYDEMRSMTWQCIADGANGIIYYSYFDMVLMDRKDPFERRWDDLCRVGREVRQYEEVILKGEPVRVTSVSPERMAARAFRFKGRIHLLAANVDEAPARFEVTVEGVPEKQVFDLPRCGVEWRVLPSVSGSATVVIRRGDNVQTSRVAVAGGVLRLSREKLSGADAVEVTPDFARASAGEEGFFVFPDGSLGTFSGTNGMFRVRSSRHPMPLWGMKTPRGVFSARVDGLPWDFDLVAKAVDGRYAMTMVFDWGGGEPEEDAVVVFTGFPQEAGYAEMARDYRAFRLARGDVRPLSERVKTQPLLARAAEAVEVRIRQAWKPAPSPVEEQTETNEPPLHVAVTFDRARAFVKACRDAGVGAAEFCLVGWNRKGHDGRYPDLFPVEPDLGGRKALERWIREVRECGYLAVCHNNHSDAYTIASRWSENDVVRLRDGKVSKNACWSAGRMYDLCPEVAWRRFASSDLKKIAALGFRGLHYIDVISIVPPRRCFAPGHRLTRRHAAHYVNLMLAEARARFGASASEGGFDFCAPSLDSALYVGFYDPEQKLPPLIDRRVPFWQLVYHGIILSNPCARTWNPTIETARRRLTVAEFGGRTTFYVHSKFFGPDAAAQRDLRLDTPAAFAAAVAAVKEGADEYARMRDLQYAFMDGHETLAPGVTETVYSTGDRVLVNYTRTPFETPDGVVPAEGYLRVTPR